MRTMTALQVETACNKSNYVLFRLPTGKQLAINSRCVNIAKRRPGFDPNNRTSFVSFKACNFQEYISKKTGFYPVTINPQP